MMLGHRRSNPALLLAGLAVVALVASCTLVLRNSTSLTNGGTLTASSTSRRMQASSSLSSSSSAAPTTVSVFYNLYIPPAVEDDAAELGRILDMFREQMRQVGKETGLGQKKNSHNGPKVVVHVISIGAKVDMAIVRATCAEVGVYCELGNHYDEGFEMVTQQHLLDYCQREENESHIVGYIHNKGSFHPSPAQDGMRRGYTEAALSEECMSMLHEDKCNVCGGAFKSIWGPMWWGTFWSARCDYVKNLVPPSELESMNTLAMETRPKEMTMDLYEEGVSLYALPEGRFAAEQFVGTHPKLVPCSYSLGKWWSADPPGELKSHVVPFSTSGDINWFFEEHLGRDMKTDNKHLTEYWFLPGLLWRYHVLYNEMPPSDSWIWRHFPDGENWKVAVEQLGYPQAFYHRVANELNGPAVPW